MSPLRLAAAVSLLPFAAYADPPKVVTDIPPVHSLVAAVMEGVGTPDLLLERGGDPHSMALRPSQAAAMAEADLIFWIGHDLTPALERAIESSGSPDRAVSLLEVEGIELLDFREGPIFDADHDDHDDHDDHAHDEKHDHDEHAHDEHAHDEHAHDDKHDHDEHAHDDKDDHDDHAGHGHEGHAHGDEDPHAWLDPENAEVWVMAIAERLAEVDPENAATYRANAEKAHAMIDAAVSEAAAALDHSRDTPFFMYHDSLQYFEHRFRIEATGSLALGDAASPGAARLAEIRGYLEEAEAACVFSEPQHNPALAVNIAEGTEAEVSVVDPLGNGLEPGPGLYPAMIVDIAESLAECLDHDH